jgi:carotenoid cleavage dioxygenase
MPVMFNTLHRYDVQTGESDEWFAGPECTLQDPVFLPRSQDAPEGEGYLVCIVNRVPTRTSEIVVLDSMDLAKGPLARIRVPVTLRSGIHAAWIPGSRLLD